jgi:hypothetical protein
MKNEILKENLFFIKDKHFLILKLKLKKKKKK